MNNKKPFSIAVVAVVCVGAFALGYYWGNQNGVKIGKRQTENKLAPLIDRAYPKPETEIKNLTGIVKGIYGAAIDFEITDPEDYLPHTDGTSQKKEIRTASVLNTTKIFLIDFKKLDKQGNPKTTEIKTSEIKIGDEITVRSEGNIKTAKKFDAYRIELLKF